METTQNYKDKEVKDFFEVKYSFNEQDFYTLTHDDDVHGYICHLLVRYLVKATEKFELVDKRDLHFRSTTELSTQEFSEYISKAVALDIALLKTFKGVATKRGNEKWQFLVNSPGKVKTIYQ